MAPRLTHLTLASALLTLLIAVGGAAAASAAPAPREMKRGCAAKSTGVLRYVSRASQCSASTETAVVLSRTAPVPACVKLHGTLNGVPGSLSQLRATAAGLASSRLPAGTTRVVASPSECGPPHQPNEAAITLPRPVKTWFCARGSRAILRYVGRRSHCSARERGVWVRKAPPPPVPNRAPVAAGDAVSTDEDHATTIAVLANDADADGDTLAVLSIDRTGTRGDVGVSGARLTYDPAGRFNALGPGETAHDSFSYRATDGHADSAPATVDVTITGVDDPPVVTAGSGAAPTYTENQVPHVVIDGGVLISDVDSTEESGATVAIGAGRVTGDALHFTTQNGITGSYDSSTGVLTLTGTATLANYENALRSVEFSTTSDDPGTARTIAFSAGGGAPAFRTIDISPINDGPVITRPSATQVTPEDTPYTFTRGTASEISVADPDAGAGDVQVTLSVNDGTLGTGVTPAGLDKTGEGTGTLTLTGTVAEIDTALDGLIYSPSQDFNGSDTLSVGVDDLGSTGSGGPLTDSQTVAISITPVNDPPSLSTSEGEVFYDPMGPPILVDDQVQLGDNDSPNLASATAKVSNDTFQTGDVLGFTAPAGIDGTYDSGTGTVTFTPTGPATSAPVADFRNALRSVTFSTSGPDTPNRVIEFRANDGTDSGGPADRTVVFSGP